MKNTKEIILKLPVVFLIGFIAFVFLPISVRAEMETDTAGSSLGKEVVDNGERANYTSVKTRAVQGWIQDSTGWWYQYSDGSYPVSSWRKIDGSWYYNIFGDKEINKIINLLPNNLEEIEEYRRSLLQGYESYLKENE